MANGRINRIINSRRLAGDRELQQRLLGVGRHSEAPPEAEPRLADARAEAASRASPRRGGALVKIYVSNPILPTRWSQPVPNARIEASARTASVGATRTEETPDRRAPTLVAHSRPPAVAVVGTLDTKGPELRFIRDLIAASGLRTRLVDVSTGGKLATCDVTAQEVALNHGRGGTAVFGRERGASVAAMAEAFEAWIRSERIARDEEIRALEIARNRALDEADIRAKEAVEAARIAQEKALAAERIQSDQETRALEIARNEAIEAAELKRRDAVERQRIDVELGLEKDRIASQQTREVMSIEQKRAIEIAEEDLVIALSSKRTERVNADKQGRQSEIVARQNVERTDVVREQALEVARLERRRALEQLEVARAQALQEAEIASREEIERARIGSERGLDEARVMRERDLRRLEIEREKAVETALMDKAIALYQKSLEELAGGSREREGSRGRGAGARRDGARKRDRPPAQVGRGSHRGVGG